MLRERSQTSLTAARHTAASSRKPFHLQSRGISVHRRNSVATEVCRLARHHPTRSPSGGSIRLCLHITSSFAFCIALAYVCVDVAALQHPYA